MSNRYTQLIPLVSYPGQGLLEAINNIEPSTAGRERDLDLRQFIQFISKTKLTELQENSHKPLI